MEDYTNKYKGEQVELALFGGEYQEGVLTAYCSIEDVPHVELNGHILVPLQNVASLHCSSRCDAPEPDWPPRGLEVEDDDTTTTDAALRLAAATNIAKAWLLVLRLAALFGAIGWLLGELRVATLFAFCSLLAASAVYAGGGSSAARDARRASVRARRRSAAPLDGRPRCGASESSRRSCA